MAAGAPQAIVDIGSNSVRLVVYSGADRVPAVIFNEKVLAGLGRGIAETGELAEDSRRHALAALARFRLLMNHMHVGRSQIVATAAVRDARNGPDFVKEIRRLGLPCKVLSAEDEARLAGEGVLSAIPGAAGVVGDLGGGSLELVEVGDGSPGKGISLPLGVLRLKPIGDTGEKRVAQMLHDALKDSGIDKAARGRTLYMVGGSWRALARVDMIATQYPLPITQQYSMAPERVAKLRQVVASADPRLVKAIAPARLASTPGAAMVLEHLVEELQPKSLVLSSFGIREGLLFARLSGRERAKDPLVEAVRDFGGAERRFGQHGDLLDQWIGGVFDDPAPMHRLRLAACLLADVAWRANPDFRADRGVEMALHGAWVGVTPAERVVMAQALSSNFGRERLVPSDFAGLCPPEAIVRAHQWGLAIRLAQRLSGGVASALSPVSLELQRNCLQLRVAKAEAALVGDPVQRRLQRLADALGVGAEVVAI